MSVKSGKCIKTGAMIKVLEYGAVQRGNVFLVGDTIIINLEGKLTYGSGPAVDHAHEGILGLTGFYDDAKHLIVVPASQYRGEVYLGNDTTPTMLEGQSLVPPTRVLVDLHGGAIHDVKADRAAEVLFISNDGDDVAGFLADDDKPALVPTTEDMDDPHAWWHHTADVSRKDVEHYFDQATSILKE